MTGNVFITIKSLQLGFEDNPIETKLQGSYSFINGSHYISYEEKLSDSNTAEKNIIRISPDRVTVTKKGTATTKLVFDEKETTDAVYLTPYGSISMSVMTKTIRIEINPDLIELMLEYSMLSGGAMIYDNQIIIKIINV